MENLTIAFWSTFIISNLYFANDKNFEGTMWWVCSGLILLIQLITS